MSKIYSNFSNSILNCLKIMSSNLLDDSDDERDNFDVEQRQIEMFQKNFLSASIESSEDDDEGIIDGTKIPSSTKVKSRARHSYLDISTLSSSPSFDHEQENPDDEQSNPFEIISKSIPIEKPPKKKKSLGVPKARIIDVSDIYDQEDDSQSRSSFPKTFDDHVDEEQPTKSKAEKKNKVRKPTKAIVLETERKMQQLSRSEQLVLPTFVPKPLETWHALEKRSRQELMNEIRAKNPSFTPQDPELPELPVVNIETTVVETLADLTKLVQDKPKPSVNVLDRLSRFLGPDILNKKPKISNIMKESNTLIDLTDTKKAPSHPTVKSSIQVSLDCVKSPSSSKKLLEMQKQLGIRMQARRAAMLADNSANLLQNDDEDLDKEEKENDDDDDDGDDDESTESNTSENNDANLEAEFNMNQDNDEIQIDEETREPFSEAEDNEIEVEEKESTNPPSDPNRPSLKTVLKRLESASESVEVQPPVDNNGRAEWFHSARPANFDSELEMLCSGAFGGDDLIPVSQNYKSSEPMAFSPLPITQLEREETDIEVRRPKVRHLIDDDDNEDGINKQTSSGSDHVEKEDEDEQNDDEAEEEEDADDEVLGDDGEENEELVDYKKQLFEMEAEESGSEADEKENNKADEDNSDEDEEEPDEELQRFIDTSALEIDDEEVDNIAKVHLKLKAKEDEHQLQLLKEQYLDFDGDDDGRRIKISKAPIDDDEDDDDPDYNSDAATEEEDDDDEDDDPSDLKDRMSELERQRSIQDNQAEELHLDEDLDNIGQHSSMFQKGLALKQKKLQSIVVTQTESVTQVVAESNTRSNNQSRSVTLSSVLLAKRFSSTLMTSINKPNATVSNPTIPSETNIAAKKQHNPRRHVFATNLATAGTNENQNPNQSAATSGEKRANSADKSPKSKIKKFKQSTTTTTTSTKPSESTASVFSALGFSNMRR